MANIKRIIERLPENIYCRSADTKIYTLLYALLNTAEKFETRTILTYLCQFIHTCRYDALDKLFGKIFRLPRLEEEKYPYNPWEDSLTPEQWLEVEAKDAKYRNRLYKFIKALNLEGTVGLKKAIEAATGIPVEIYHQKDFGGGISDPINDPEGLYEFTIVPLTTDWDERDTLRAMILANRLRPLHTTYRIVPGIDILKEEPIESISASSSFVIFGHQIDIYNQVQEYDSENLINGINAVSSELMIVKEVGRKDPKRIIGSNAVKKTEGSGAPFIFRRIKYHSSSVVPWYGGPDPLYKGTRGANAFDGNDSTYWLSVGNASPNAYYSYEWIECELDEHDEGTGFNEIWVKFPWETHMSMWICVMDRNGNWWNLGGQDIPYGDYPAGGAKEYPSPCKPNGADTPYVFYTPDVSVYKRDDGWHVIYLGKWFHNTKYVRLTFHNLDRTNIGPYYYRAAVTEIRVVANLLEYYGAWRASSYQEYNVPWISQAVDTSDSQNVWLRVILNTRQPINRIKIVAGERTRNQIVKLVDKDGNLIKDNIKLQTKDNIIPISTKNLDIFYIYPQKMERLSILSDSYGLEICKVEAWYEEYVPGEVITVTEKPYPAKYACDNNPETYWQSELRNSSKESVEWIEFSLKIGKKDYTVINRVSVLAADRGLTYRVMYAEPTIENGKTHYTWRYANISNLWETERDYSCVFNFSSPVSAAAIRLEIDTLASVGQGKYAARIKEVKAWLHVKEITEVPEIKEYVKAKEWEPQMAIDGNENTLWRSAGASSPDAVEVLNITLPSSASAIAGFYVDPEFPGVACNVLYSQDGEIYNCIAHDYWLERGMIWLPRKIRARYWRLEFTKLKEKNFVTKTWDNYVVNYHYPLEFLEIAQYGEMPYPKPLPGIVELPRPNDDSFIIRHPANLEQVIGIDEKPSRFYVGIREIKAYGYELLGTNPYEIYEDFCDNKNISEDSTVIWDEENEVIRANGEAVYKSKLLDLATDLRAVSVSVDQYVPEGMTVRWFVTSDESTWYDVSYLINKKNAWFVFPNPGDKFGIKCEITGSNTEHDYVCNRYEIKFNYYIEM